MHNDEFDKFLRDWREITLRAVGRPTMMFTGSRETIDPRELFATEWDRFLYGDVNQEPEED